MPEELDPEALRVLRYLLQKTASPGEYVGMASQLYRPTKDFRVLECVADGVPGHSPEAVYRYLEMAGQVVAEIHEEATCDAVTARVGAMLPKAANDVDRRALRLLLVMVESRAGMVAKTDPAHGPRALAALRAAFDGALVPGERVLLARRLAALDPAKVPGLPEEQMARLEALRAGSTEGVLERLALDRAVADVLWRRGQRDAAVERLEAALAAVRAESEGTLPPEASDDYDALVGWWTELGRFRVAETRLRDDLAHETRSQRRDRLRMRLFALYAQAIRRGGATALGSGAELLEAAATEMETFLAEGPGVPDERDGAPPRRAARRGRAEQGRPRRRRAVPHVRARSAPEDPAAQPARDRRGAPGRAAAPGPPRGAALGADGRARPGRPRAGLVRPR